MWGGGIISFPKPEMAIDCERFSQKPANCDIVPHGELFEVTTAPATLKVEV